MTMLSVFTPSHDPRYLDECWASLAVQTHPDFEWVVVLNGGARWDPPPDSRIRCVTVDEIRGVGAAKRYACSLATGDILVELDHDDLLTTDALSQIDTEFAIYPDVGFVYSDGAQVKADGRMDESTWDKLNGWVYYREKIDGRVVQVVEALEPSPHNVSLIWFAPNHVRAFRRDIYERVGGYNMALDVLDDQDLMCRLYQATEFRRIPQCLYLQRVHDGNTQRVQAINDRIQSLTVEMYDGYVEPNATAWARRRGLELWDLGGGHNPAPGYLTLDTVQTGDVDMVGDVMEILGQQPDDTVGVIRAYDFLEHIADTVGLMNEIHRVLAPDGLLLSCTPSTDGRGAYQDPTHVSFFNQNSWWYFTDADYARYVPAITARFQTSRLVTYFPTQWHRDNDTPYVQANLVALKDGGVRNGGYLRW